MYLLSSTLGHPKYVIFSNFNDHRDASIIKYPEILYFQIR